MPSKVYLYNKNKDAAYKMVLSRWRLVKHTQYTS